MPRNPLGAIRRWLVAVRDAMDGGLHPWRYRRARNRLRELRPQRILFVCLGNICRSPYGERVMARGGKAWLEVGSAGFIGPDRPPPENALAVARRRGIEHGDHRSRLVTPGLAAEADAVFLFDRLNWIRLAQLRAVSPGRVFWLGDFDPRWAGKRAIPDPWGRPEAEFEEAFERIERCVDSALNALP